MIKDAYEFDQFQICRSAQRISTESRNHITIEGSPAVSQSPRLTVLPSTITLALKLSNTVGT